MQRFLAFLVLCGLVWLPQSQGATSPAKLEAEIPKLMEQGNIPGLSIAVIRNGQIAWQGAFGRREPAKDSLPVDAQTVFAAASLSKPAFAYCVFRLVDRGEFDLDKPLYSYLPYPRLEHDERYKRITARMVLSHTTGLPNWGGTPLNLINPPGERFGYSGEGFVYLQKAIEKLTGQSLNDLARKEVFTPLGMERSSYVWAPDLASNIVNGLSRTGDTQKIEKRDANAAASLLTTAQDFARFAIAVMEGRGLKPESSEIMLRPAVKAKSQGLLESNGKIYWGLGWGLQQTDADNAFWHWGDNGAFKAYVEANRATRSGMVYFANSDGGLSILGAITSLALGGNHPAVGWLDYEPYDFPKRAVRKEAAAALQDRGVDAGVERYRELALEWPQLMDYDFTNDLAWSLLLKNKPAEAAALFKTNIEQADRRAANAHEALAQAYAKQAEDALALAEMEKSVQLRGGGDQGKKQIAWLRESLEAKKNPPALPPELLSRYAGEYKDRKVALKDGSLYLSLPQAPQTPPRRLVPISTDTFNVEGDPTGRVRFIPDKDGPAKKLLALWLFGAELEFERIR